MIQWVNDFTNKLNKRLDDTNFVLQGGDIDEQNPNDIYDIPIHDNMANEGLENGDKQLRLEADDVNSSDNLIAATFLLDPLKSPDNVGTRATVLRRKTDHLGNPLGKAHTNPLLDTHKYEVQLESSTYDSYFANAIAKNLFSQCDAEGREFNNAKIIGNKTDENAIAKADGSY